MHRYIVKTETAAELAKAIKKNHLNIDGYCDEKIRDLADNQAVNDDKIIRDALSLIESYRKMGVNCYDTLLEFLLSQRER